ncbi:4-phosphoerythronate dehydrogenase PdxB [Salmonella bongori]|uniref:4-phosphoerythronate dehydrogenase PdxB n=1 Tax=Salmonella bongori TaxID=54736 RepID=UPI0009AA24C2|nr:4-phosphoerythronate dehydrogenase PdxB [Salmonella bongori]EGE4655487.1 4-phosphoerythronate dehydrogenase PdxB [Salmonella bongori serovar 40:z35:- str. 95-0123]EGE4658740.1 4-phosphoerythronate dehydrogenase PdxB [Salmonella bongori serovar 48:i:- str. 94-0708]EHM2230165.1 4-phosphoerythronate dehydrogenase PdxB [Salmonella bongori]EIT4621351.1 4-phosphoerythronate dehydrogenase PdxB [Salmonella bongori]QVP38627.1 4-phosphoerythronate dehydrogenase PdxB [Salmonella bongori serovar 40:z35
MKILVDENMPYARELFSRLGEVKAVPGRPIPVEELNHADALMVRSVTKVNESLLSGKPINFVGTATAGTDHVDEAWLKQAGIGFSAAPGCNAIAVVEYVFSALLMLAERDSFSLRDRTVGIIGVGNVGSRLQARLEALGIRTLLCDPPRADRGDEGDFRTLDEVVVQADVLTFHTPLYKDGPYKTLHLADETLIRRLKPGAILINACRGPVVDNAALLARLNAGQSLSVVLDVWEAEPDLNVALLEAVDIGTSHIAGYTLEGKARGTTQVFEAYSAFIGREQSVALETLLPAPEFGRITLHGPLDQATLKRLVHLVYDVRRDDAPLRKVAGIPGEFDKLRKNYLERREWSSLYVMCDDASAAALLQKLGFNAVHHPAR